MAQDDRTTDHFIREVDEELRRDQLRALWERFGVYFIIACVLVVAATAGYRGWTWWQQKQAAERGDRYLAALEAIDDPDIGSAQLRKLAEQGGGYGILARMQLAASDAAAGNAEEALAAFDAIAADSRIDTVVRDLAKLRAGMVALNAGDIEGARRRVAGLDQPGNSWRQAAREIQALADFTDGDLEAARKLYQTIQQDAEAPGDARQRAAAMVTLIDGMQEAPSADATGSDTQSPD